MEKEIQVRYLCDQPDELRYARQVRTSWGCINLSVINNVAMRADIYVKPNDKRSEEEKEKLPKKPKRGNSKREMRN